MKIVTRVLVRVNNLPIGKKLTALVLSISIVILVVSTIVETVFVAYMEHDFLKKRLQFTANIVAVQSIAPLEFSDPVTARENLASLRVQPAITKACLYDITGNVFASAILDISGKSVIQNNRLCPAIHSNTTSKFRFLVVFTNVVSGTQKIGTLYLEYDLSPLYENMLRILIFNLTVISASILFAYTISSYLQRVISLPVVALAKATRHFALSHDYNVRAVKYANDELGGLVDDFNMMITELEKHEAKLERAIDDLQKSNSELERFAYICSHDLQEPLRMISNYTQLLSQHIEQSDQDTKEYMAFIVESAARMRNQINDILAYSRIGGSTEPLTAVNIVEVMELVQKNLMFAIQESKAVVTCSFLPTIQAYKTLLVQIFQNLISNALKFHKKDEYPAIHINARRVTKAWEFSIQDNGIGIEPAYHKKIFEIFRRLNRREEYEGTGIGLSICKKAVEYHGGHIWVTSNPGGGSTFFFTIADIKPSRKEQKS